MTKVSPPSATDWIATLTRPVIAQMQAYSARGAATDALHLDANESPWAPPPGAPKTDHFNRYPAQQPPALRLRLAKLYGVQPESVMMGRGADEAIDILLRTFCEPHTDKVLICPPTFGYFKIAAQVQSVDIIEVPLRNDFTPDADAVRNAISAQTPKLIFICSPNNPTGLSWDPQTVETLAAEFPNSLFVIDEAYIEFSNHESCTALQENLRNIIILRTLSKAYGLAGVRTGVALAHSAIIDMMCKVLPPYPVPRPVEQAALQALSPSAMHVHTEHLRIWAQERDRMFAALKTSEFVTKVYASDANFILFEAADPEALRRQMEKFNIKIRDFTQKIPQHFRMSIGSPEENSVALQALGVESVRPSHHRVGEIFRTTKETDISVRVNLDDTSGTHIHTGIGFFDHMLEQIAKHGGMGLVLACEGDLIIDSHHSVEDTALAFGAALKQALGDKAGIGRYGFMMPMDETLAQVAIDLSGRPAFSFEGEFPTETVGEFAAEMCPHFFQSLSQALGASIQIKVRGENTHHMIEACFKGVGRALRPALAKSGKDMPSTKGVL